MEIKEYREHVRILASRREGVPIYNGSAEHATIIVEELFSSASQHVRILSGELNARIYGNPHVVQRAKEFLGHSDHHLDILVERCTFSASHPLIEEIGDAPNLTISHIIPEVSALIRYHFMTADEDCFRFEEEKESNIAVAAFGDRDSTGNLNSIFDAIKTSSVPIDMSAQLG